MAYDHIIIGSGINGLVAAAMLARQGDRVLVLEREATLGGCLRTEDITLPGFHHDVMAATWVLFMTSPAGAVLGPHLARHGFDYCHTPHPTAVLRPDGQALVLTTDRAKNIATFNALAAGDGDRHAADVGGDVLRVGQVDVEHGDLGAQAGEFAGGGLAEARSAAGDEGGLSLNVHGWNS